MANLSASDLAGLRIRQLRQQRNWTAKELADRCAEAGVPQITATVITNLETRRRASREITVDEVLALARVLDVHPMQLIIPIDASERLEVLPGTEMDALEAVKWIGGPAAPVHYRELLSIRPEETTRLLRLIVRDDMLNILRLADYAIWHITGLDKALQRDPERERGEWRSLRLRLLADRLMHLAARLEALGYEPPSLDQVQEILKRRELPSTLEEWRERAEADSPPEYDDDEESGI